MLFQAISRTIFRLKNDQSLDNFQVIVMVLINLFKNTSCALGVLGRRFESCRPDSLKPIHTSELPRLAFLLEIMWVTSADKKPTKSNFYIISF